MGAERAIDFAAIDWVEILPGLRAKVCQGDGRVVRLVEFGGGFEEPGWCEKGHAGYVVSGRLTVRFDDGIVTYETGQGGVHRLGRPPQGRPAGRSGGCPIPHRTGIGRKTAASGPARE